MTPNWIGQWGAWFHLCPASQAKDDMGATPVVSPQDTPRCDHMGSDPKDHSWTGQARQIPDSLGQVCRTGCSPGPPVGNVQAGLNDLGLPGSQTLAATGTSPYLPNSGVKEPFCWRKSEWKSTWEHWLLMAFVTLAPDQGHPLPLFFFF